MMMQGKVWGFTSQLFRMNNVEMHYIRIGKGGFCSKHVHTHKFNKFIVLEGKLRVCVWKDYGSAILEDITVICANQETTVTPGDYHRFEALEDTIALEVYWVELSASDIKREDHGGIKIEATSDIDDENAGGRKKTISQCPAYLPPISTLQRVYGDD